jgi:hypothetical protein
MPDRGHVGRCRGVGGGTRTTDFIISSEDLSGPDAGLLLVRNRFMLLGAVMRSLLPTMAGNTLRTVVTSGCRSR